MKIIYLIRHAKSDWSIPGLPDIDRHLNPRGYRDAHRIGNKLKQSITGKFILISSPAIRAISTALIIAREIDYSAGKIRIMRELYEAEEKMYYKIISSIEEDYDTVLIFGHNPTISNVFSWLTDTVPIELPTCSVSVIESDSTNWSECADSKNKMTNQLFPSHLKEQD